MPPLRKALISLFGGINRLPTPEDLDASATRIFHAVKEAVEDDDGDDSVTRRDMYTYLVLHSEGGVSKRTADTLFDKVDVDGSGSISRDEFVEVIRRCYTLLVEQLAIEGRAAAREVPELLVVPGSSAHNARSGTRAFSTAVVRRSSMRRLWKVFNDIDFDSDGYISLPEFKRYLKRPNHAHLADMACSIFSTMDKSNNGLVTFKEVLYNMYPMAAEADVKLLMRMARPKDYVPTHKPDTTMLAEIQEIFRIYDDDKSGALDIEEFAHALQLIGFDEEEAQRIFTEIDKDGSGEVSFEEFEFWYETANVHPHAADPTDPGADLEDEEAV